jgi:hypothetical protein
MVPSVLRHAGIDSILAGREQTLGGEMMRRVAGLMLIVLTGLSCSDLTGQGPVTFCMQWVNTSSVDVTFTATDDVGDQLSQLTMDAPGIGDAFASPLVKLSGAAPITFSANQGYGSLTFKPSGGNKILLVEASGGATKLTKYEETGE